MKKTTLIIITAAAAAFIMTGCGSLNGANATVTVGPDGSRTYGAGVTFRDGDTGKRVVITATK